MKVIDKENAARVFRENLEKSKAGHFYRPADVDAFMDESLKYVEFRGKKKKAPTLNIPCAFDTETTSTYYNDEKFACMYEWTLGINGVCMIGRTYEELTDTLNAICRRLDIDGEHKTITFYVHNLGFDFQFIRKHFEINEVFARNTYKPMMAHTAEGVIFRDSYVLTGYSLAKTAENLNEIKGLEKLVGDLDYSKIRHYNTPLTAEEEKYCLYDVLIIMADIYERMRGTGWNISRIPMTKTGYARNLCRTACTTGKIPGETTTEEESKKAYYKHKDLMNSLRLSEYELRQAKRAFAGGFTHANAMHVKETCKDVRSFDFTSSYPAVMCAEKFPMSRGTKLDNKQALDNIDFYIKNYCCLFDIKFYNLRVKDNVYDSYISRSKCFRLKECLENNGRIWEAKEAALSITDVDFTTIQRCYDFDHYEIANFRIYRRGYLPKEYIKTVLYLYAQKTQLKGVKGKEAEYQSGKELLNSLYGMMVTDVIGEDVTYEAAEWKTGPKDIKEAVEEYNNSKSRFISYLWGVWVTAYARRNLWSGILECGEDFIYSDTDSIKIFNYEKHKEYFEKYNEYITKKLDKMADFYGIDKEKTRPKTIKGKTKQLGVWDDDGAYNIFKTLGAKRYIYEEAGELHITVAGVNKEKTAKYLIEKYKTIKNVFDNFDADLYIPPEYEDDDGNTLDAAGKKTHAYIDDERTAVITDYLGNTETVTELSSCHLEACDYSLSISEQFASFILNIQLDVA